MNIANLKNETLLYLINATAESAKSEVYGYKKSIVLEDLLVPFSVVEMIEADESLDCAYNMLNSYLTSIRSTMIGSKLNITRYVTITSGGSSYKGSLSTQSEAIMAAAGSHQDGDWWSISGDFTYSGSNYFTGEEVFWNGTTFEKSGNTNPYARIIVASGNSSEEQDGNWRMRVSGGNLVMEKRESGSWVTYQTIS